MLGTLITGSAVDSHTHNYMNRGTKMLRTFHTDGGLVRTLLVLAALVSISYAATYGQIRLVGNKTVSGRVEIYYSGRWGTICHTNWGREEIRVICRIFGHRSGKRIAVTPGIGTIWLDNVGCKGNETSLVQCKHNGFGTHNCEHSQDVGVACDLDTGVTRTCDFEWDKCGFYTEPKGKYPWLIHKATTPSRGTGPQTDHTTGLASGRYFYAEASNAAMNQKSLLRSSFNITTKSGSIYFWYHMLGKNMGTLNLYIGKTTKDSLIWSQTGNQGNEWIYACRTILTPIRGKTVIFEAVRGLDFTSDIAIDDFGISEDFCSDQNGTCGFNGNYCGYTIIQEKGDGTRWEMARRNIPLNDHSDVTNGEYVTLTSTGDEGERTHLKSPAIKSYDTQMRIEFYYYLYGYSTGELQVRYEKINISSEMQSTKNVWQDFGDHGQRWNYGCMDIPVGESGSVKFTGISGTKRGRFIAIDDTHLSKGGCKVGADHMKCTFDNALVCKYKINCTSLREYTWRRNYGRTPTRVTGPPSDDSPRSDGYYLYAESSYGNPGDAVSITFPVSHSKVRYLKFSYHMYGTSVGDLIVHKHKNGDATEVWKKSGNHKFVWHRECREIGSNIDDVSFIAVRGSSFMGDVAIDNVFLDSKPCPHTVNCDFQTDMCNFQINVTHQNFTWENILYSNVSGVINRIAAVSSGEKTKEGMTATLTTTPITPVSKSSFQFRYMMFGKNAGKLSVSLKHNTVNSALNYVLSEQSSEEVWSTTDNEAKDWILGCIPLPTDNNLHVQFTVTAGDGPEGSVYLDEVVYYPDKSCHLGIVENGCRFDEPNMCEYRIRCSDADRYTWKRGKTTLTKTYGPTGDHTGTGKRYFMYAEASTGRAGAMTYLDFPNINPPSGHYLEFYYLMNGADIGSFHVSVETPDKQETKWRDNGHNGLMWIRGCVNMDGYDNATVVFTAKRGNGPYGDIAIDDISFKPGVCRGSSIDCEFDDDILCGYRNVSLENSWMRIKEMDTSTDGYYMEANKEHRNNIMSSLKTHIVDSCIRVYYKLVSRFCHLIVHSSSDTTVRFSVSGINDTDYKIGQIYIKDALTQIILKSSSDLNWFGICNTRIDKVEVIKGSCPTLACPLDERACEDDKHCVSEDQVCDRANDCTDTSDEQNCPAFIDCDFEFSYYCGYELGQEWQRLKVTDFPNNALKRNGSEYIMVLNDKDGSMFSPVEDLDKTCIQFDYYGTSTKDSDLRVVVHHVSSLSTFKELGWIDFYPNNNDWRMGQFYVSRGRIKLEFLGKATGGNLVIDNVLLLDGLCPKLECPADMVACASGTHCIKKKYLCNSQYECRDRSDELNCTKTIACDFEDTYLCGYANSTWTLTNGRRHLIPPRELSEGTYLGKYMVSNSSSGASPKILASPTETFSSVTCVSFYYSFHGDGYLSIHDNDNLTLNIYPFNIKTWRKAQFEVQSGNHQLTFTHTMFSNNSILALDSISKTPGNCSPLDCGENWVLCKNENVCIPHFKQCDGVIDCYGNTDEAECHSFKSTVRLIEGGHAAQGIVEIERNGTWYKICRDHKSNNLLNLVCLQLGYNGTNRGTFVGNNPYRDGEFLHIDCMDKETSFELCTISTCNNCNCQDIGVDCSNTSCPSDHVLCPPSKAARYTTTNECIPRHNLCDGEYDCPGGTDEESCGSCKVNEFKCRSMECISNSLRCNGIKDCEDGSDEYHCFKYSETSKLMEVYFNGNYTPLCKDNLLRQGAGDILCKTIGKSNSKIGTTHTVVKGVFFTPQIQHQGQLLPGFDLNPPRSCETLNLTCAHGECGKRSRKLFDFMIQYGSNALPGEWPWQIALFNKGIYICGGTLIDDYNIITAAHCVKDKNASDIIVFAGSIQRAFGGITYSVNTIHAHPSFDNYLLQNDVAVIQLQQPVEMSDYIHPACLPEKKWTLDMECFTTGWGINEEGVTPEKLQETRVDLLSRSDCKEYHEHANEAVVCANNKEPYQPGCYGDSGGPLVCRNDHGFWELFGITSYGISGCASDISNPQAYADVYTLKSWILDHML